PVYLVTANATIQSVEEVWAIFGLGRHTAVDLIEIFVYDHLAQDLEGHGLVLARLQNRKGVAVQFSSDLPVNRRHYRNIPVLLLDVKAAGVPGVSSLHCHVAGFEGATLA